MWSLESCTAAIDFSSSESIHNVVGKRYFVLYRNGVKGIDAAIGEYI